MDILKWASDKSLPGWACHTLSGAAKRGPPQNSAMGLAKWRHGNLGKWKPRLLPEGSTKGPSEDPAMGL